MDTPTCETCAYWMRTTEHQGECRAGQPRLAATKAQQAEAYDAGDALAGFWPSTARVDFCGEHPRFPAYIASQSADGPKDGAA